MQIFGIICAATLVILSLIWVVRAVRKSRLSGFNFYWIYLVTALSTLFFGIAIFIRTNPGIDLGNAEERIFWLAVFTWFGCGLLVSLLELLWLSRVQKRQPEKWGRWQSFLNQASPLERFLVYKRAEKQ